MEEVLIGLWREEGETETRTLLQSEQPIARGAGADGTYPQDEAGRYW